MNKMYNQICNDISLQLHVNDKVRNIIFLGILPQFDLSYELQCMIPSSEST